MNEAAARITINKLLEAAGWRFFADGNISALRQALRSRHPTWTLWATTSRRLPKAISIFCFSTPRGSPLIVLEAKSEDKNPLVGKEQVRKYARSQNCRFVILSNGNLHYFWESGTWQPRCHHLLPDAGLGIRLPEDHTQPTAPDQGTGRRRLHPFSERIVSSFGEIEYLPPKEAAIIDTNEFQEAKALLGGCI